MSWSNPEIFVLGDKMSRTRHPELGQNQWLEHAEPTQERAALQTQCLIGLYPLFILALSRRETRIRPNHHQPSPGASHLCSLDPGDSCDAASLCFQQSPFVEPSFVCIYTWCSCYYFLYYCTYNLNTSSLKRILMALNNIWRQTKQYQALVKIRNESKMLKLTAYQKLDCVAKFRAGQLRKYLCVSNPCK